VSEDETTRLTTELLDELRSIDGFPIAEDKDISALSDPPYYTACPNPFIVQFIKNQGKLYDAETDSYHRKPFASDVSEGKSDPIYMAHTYHTKVPHKALMRYILHYTDPGDIVLDSFCGTGMTGVAAQMCGQPDPSFKKIVEQEMPYTQWGSRKAILCDISPVATFIAYNLNTSVDVTEFEHEVLRILIEVEKECGWMYETTHVINDKVQYSTDINGIKKPVNGNINYVIWTDVFVCPGCSGEFNFWDVAVTKDRKLLGEFYCPHCNAILTKKKIERTWVTTMDYALGKTVKGIKRVPVLINYTVKEGRRHKRYEKRPDAIDLNIIKKSIEVKIPYPYPIKKFREGVKTNEPISKGMTHVHHVFSKRNLYILSNIVHLSKNSKYKRQILFLLTSFLVKTGSLLHNVGLKKGKINLAGALPNALYIPSNLAERNLFIVSRNKMKDILKIYYYDKEKFNYRITTQSASKLLIPNNAIDYIFTDPPFGANLMYSELNFIWESWLNVHTNNKEEAIVNRSQYKGLKEYQHLMEQCFRENMRILKPGRWMTVEFHNSQNSVWIAIQQALTRAGFVIADIRILDKKQGTFNQMTTTSAVKQDLIISAYKPYEDLEKDFRLKAGTEEGVWAFIRYHLKHLPVYVENDGNVEIIAERQSFLLFDRMVAFHVQRGITVPISASEFYAGLKQRFPIRDDMHFTVDQVHEYDRKRMNAKRVEQVSLFVHDERSAIQWLRRELSRESQTYQNIQPKFLKELYKEKHEDLPELSKILEQNFLQNDDGKWYIPDSSKEVDLEKLRNKTLLREFQEYKEAKGRLRLFRSEAVRTGFSECWRVGDYETIVEVAEKLPTNVLQEEPTLLMYYDNAIILTQE